MLINHFCFVFNQNKSGKFEYKSPSPPLPHKDPTTNARIGSHLIGDANDEQRPVSVTVTKATITTSPQVVDGGQKVIVSPSETTTVSVDKPKTIDFPSSFSPSVAPTTTKTSEVRPVKVRELTSEDRKLLKTKQKDAVEYLKQRAGFKLELLEKSSTNATTTKKELKAREKQAEKVSLVISYKIKNWTS